MEKIKKHKPFRVLTLYESMGGTSLFAHPELTEEDLFTLMHAYVCVHTGVVSRDAFTELLKKDKWMQAINEDVSDFIEELGRLGELIITTKPQEQGASDEAPTATMVAGLLVVECGLSPKYVLDEMQMWEVTMYVSALNRKEQKRMEERRLFSFLQLTPWLNDSQQLSPADLITFPWEEGTRGIDHKSFIEHNYEALNDILNNNSNGERGTDISGTAPSQE